MFRKITHFLGCFLLFVAAYLTFVRILRRFYKFPMPHFMAPIIDNPLRRKFQPPDLLAVRHGLQPGMTALEVGPGSGRYTVAAARRVGAGGKVIAIDIEPRMLEKTACRAEAEGAINIETRLANVHALPFDSGMFDAIYMITVIGEIPQPEKAAQEFQRVLKPGGTLAFSELLPDPDYPLAGTLIRLIEPAGFRLKQRFGNFFAYTLLFEKE